MMWTYTMQGAPPHEPQHLTQDEHEPGHIIMAERAAEPGVCDLYVLKDRNDAYRTATYVHKASGTPEQVMEAMPAAVADLRQP